MKGHPLPYGIKIFIYHLLSYVPKVRASRINDLLWVSQMDVLQLIFECEKWVSCLVPHAISNGCPAAYVCMLEMGVSFEGAPAADKRYFRRQDFLSIS